jgi:type II restriction enzyme
MDAVPASGRIALISNGIAKAKREVLKAWRSSIFLHGEPNITSRSWLLAVMMCIERMNKQTFTLADIYASEDYLSGIFPGNRHVRPKIRQQLQVLREQGYLNFVGGGVYTRAHGECFPQ